MRAVARVLSVAVLLVPVLCWTAAPASAVCTTHVPPAPPVSYPCPGTDADWQPVPAPVWVTTTTGPGWERMEYAFIKIEQGSRLFLVNEGGGSGPDFSERMWGDGFDSGVVPEFSYAEVMGVSELPVGGYVMHNSLGERRGDLHIVPRVTDPIVTCGPDICG